MTDYANNDSYGKFKGKKQKKKKKNMSQQTILTDEESFIFGKLFDSFKEISDDEEKETAAEGFFELLCSKSNVAQLLTDHRVSHMIDEFITHANFSSIQPFLCYLTEDLRQYSVDRCASHVIQASISFSSRFIQNFKKENNETTEEKLSEVLEFVTKIVKFMYNNFTEFIFEINASYVLRTLFEVISGVMLPPEIRNTGRAHFGHDVFTETSKNIEVSRHFKKFPCKFVERLCQMSNFEDVMFHESASAVVQSLVYVLSETGDSSNLDSLISHILSHGFEPLVEKQGDMLNCMFQSHAACRLLESIIPVANEKQQYHLFLTMYKDNMETLTNDRIANHSIQKLCSSWKDKKTFSELLDSIVPCFQEICNVGYTAVIHFLAKTCRRLQSKQKGFVEALKTLLNCNTESTSSHLVLCLLYLQPFGNSQIGQIDLSLHGSLILQELLNFKKTAVVVDSLLSLEVRELSFMVCHPKGSHIVDSLVKSSTVSTEKKIEFVDKFKDIEVDLACSKNGSRSLENIWMIANTEQKIAIGNRLLERESMLRESMFGKLIYEKLKLRTHKENVSNGSFGKNMKTKASKRRLESLLEGVDFEPQKKPKSHNKKQSSKFTQPWKQK